ncbi:unnamed protein product, partial [Meganyctiphanes norvegica]
KVWSRRRGGLLRKPALLVWNQFRANKTEAVKDNLKRFKTDLAVIPGGLTSQLQPLDVCINKPFKAFMKDEWNKWMMLADYEVTAIGRRKRATIAQLCQWVKNSWDQVKEEIIIKSFKKCGNSNALDGTEDDAIFEDNLMGESDVDDPDAPNFVAGNSNEEDESGNDSHFSTDDNDFLGF